MTSSKHSPHNRRIVSVPNSIFMKGYELKLPLKLKLRYCSSNPNSNLEGFKSNPNCSANPNFHTVYNKMWKMAEKPKFCRSYVKLRLVLYSEIWELHLKSKHMYLTYFAEFQYQLQFQLYLRQFQLKPNFRVGIGIDPNSNNLNSGIEPWII